MSSSARPASSFVTPRPDGNGNGRHDGHGHDGQALAQRVADFGLTNVGDAERVGSAVLGGALLLYGASRRDLPGAALALLGGILLTRGATGHCPAYAAMGVDTSGERASHVRPGAGPNAVLEASRALRVDRSVMIERSPEELYAFWRDLANLPRVMSHLESVRVLSPTRSHWKVRAPGRDIEWDAVIIRDEPNRLISWKSVDGAMVPNAGSVQFIRARGSSATDVHVELEYDPPGGELAKLFAQLFGDDADSAVRDDLDRFRQAMERGQREEGRRGR